MTIRIAHKVCGGLAGFWTEPPGMWDNERSKIYRAPSMLRLEANEEVYCGKCNCRVDFIDMAWPKEVEKQKTVYEQIMAQQYRGTTYNNAGRS